MNDLEEKRLNECSGLLAIALHVRGTNPCHNTQQSLNEAIDVADCCRQMSRCDLANELLDLVDTFPLGAQEPVATRVREQRDLIAKGDTSGRAQAVASDLPPLLIRGWNFAWAMTRWVGSGFTMRSHSEIAARLAICQSCEHLVNDHCNLCGCACTETEQVMNKLAIASEKCPIGKWS
jgi:hypothetical protein